MMAPVDYSPAGSTLRQEQLERLRLLGPRIAEPVQALGWSVQSFHILYFVFPHHIPWERPMPLSSPPSLGDRYVMLNLHDPAMPDVRTSDESDPLLQEKAQEVLHAYLVLA